MRWKLAHPWWGSNPRSPDYIPSSITRPVSDHQSKASQIYFYISGSSNKEIVYENDKKKMNWICPMTAILNGTICGKTVSFTAWHTPEMDSARNLYIEPTNEILFLKNTYRSLFRAIFQYFVLTIPRVPDPTSKWKMVSDYFFYSVRKQSTTMPYIPISELAHMISKQLLFVCVQRGALLSRLGCYSCACHLNRVARVMLS